MLGFSFIPILSWLSVVLSDLLSIYILIFVVVMVVIKPGT